MQYLRPFIFIILILVSQNLTADELIGKIKEIHDSYVEVRAGEREWIIEIGEDQDFYSRALESMVDIDYYLRFETKKSGEGDLRMVGMPATVGGDKGIEGVLSKSSDEEGIYYLGRTRARFGETKLVNGYSFDQKSREFYLGKKVITQGYFDGEGVFVINAILPQGLFSAKFDPRYYPHGTQTAFNASPYRYVKKDAFKNENAKSNNSFRGIVFQKDDYDVKPGDSVLILSLSGRQGEDLGAAGGHFVAGLGSVNADYSIKGELFNIYVKNKKNIVSGNNDLIDYYGGLISGQNNYRPTFTLLLYGEDKEKFLQMRDYIDRLHPLFRSGEIDLSINFNCTTVTWDAFNSIGVYGRHQILWPIGSIKQVPPPTIDPGKEEMGKMKQAGYLLKTPLAYVAPRAAFLSMFENINYLIRKKALKAKRMDYVFFAQVPSNRPVGGAPGGTSVPQVMRLGYLDAKYNKDPESVDVESVLDGIE